MKWREVIKLEKGNIITMFLSVLIAMLLMGYIWKDDYTVNIPFGVLNEDDSALSRSIVAQLEANATLDVNYYATSQEDLIQAIKDKRINGGMVIPAGFGQDVSLKKSPKALIFGDGTNIMLGGTAYGAASTVIGTINAGTQLKMLEGKNLYPAQAQASLGSFSYVERVVYEPIGNYGRRMSYTLVPLIIMQTFCAKFFLPMLLKKRETFVHADKKTVIHTLSEMAKRTTVIMLAGIFASFFVLLVLAKLHDLPLRGDIFIYFVSMAAFMLNALAFAMACGSVIERLAHFVQIYSMGSTVLVFAAGIVYPYFLVPDFLLKLIHFFCPLAPLSIELKALNLKGIGWDVATPYLLDSLVYTVVWLTIGVLVYAFRIWLRKKKIASENGVVQPNDV